MAGLTLAEASKLTKNELQKGVIQTIARESSVVELLPFVEVQGNAISFTREADTGTVGFRAVNEDYAHANPTYANKTEHLKRLGSKVEVDRFIEYTQNITDVRAEATQAKAKAIANEFTRTFFKGDTAVNPLEFDGLDKRMLPENIIDAEGQGLNSGLLHELLDRVMNGADVLYMNKKTRRKLTALFMAQGAYIQENQDTFGRFQQYFGDVRIAVVEDFILPENEVYAVKFGMDEGVCGIQSGELMAVDNGLRGTVYETLIEWYVSIVDGNPKGIAKLTNIAV